MWRGNSSVGFIDRLEDRRLLASVPLAADFQLNPYSVETLDYSVTPSDAKGNSVSIWQESGTLRGQRYNAKGTAIGKSFQVDVENPEIPEQASVSINTKGSFVVVWRSMSESGASSIRARQFSAAGVALGKELVVASSADSDLIDPAVAMNAKGQFVITWTGSDGDDRGVFTRQYSAKGVAAKALRANTYTSRDQAHSAVALDNKGQAIVTWQSNNQDGSGQGIFAQRINAKGNLLGKEFRVNSNRKGHQQLPDVSVNSKGTFLITWATEQQDGDGYGIVARTFAANGSSKAPEFQVNTSTANDQIIPSIASSSKGEFLIAWTSLNSDNTFSTVTARRYDAAGKVKGAEFNAPSIVGLIQPLQSYVLSERGDLLSTYHFPVSPTLILTTIHLGHLLTPSLHPPIQMLQPSSSIPSPFTAGGVLDISGFETRFQLDPSQRLISSSDPMQGSLRLNSGSTIGGTNLGSGSLIMTGQAQFPVLVGSVQDGTLILSPSVESTTPAPTPTTDGGNESVSITDLGGFVPESLTLIEYEDTESASGANISLPEVLPEPG